MNDDLIKKTEEINSLYKKNVKNLSEKILHTKIKLGFINESNNPNPEYATKGSSGFDIRAFCDEEITLEPGERKAIPTGLYFDIPTGFEIQIRPRSGLAINYGITVLNTPGTIDSDYIGEIKIILINHSHTEFYINNGDRIAQGVFSGVISKQITSLIELDKLEKDTDRGANGFGSSGID